MQAYSDTTRENDPYALPDIEVFRAGEGELVDDNGDPLPAGWYWWTCFPGCLSDSPPFGPFASKHAALRDARDSFGE